MKPKPITPIMQELIDFVAKRPDYSIYRHPGGFWGPPAISRETSNAYSFAEIWGTSTVAGLVKRGVLIYSQWRAGARGDEFPIKATLALSAAPAVVDTRQPSE